METKLSDAKVKLNMNADLLFYTSVMAQLDIRIGESLYGTAHTNGKEVVIDPTFIERLPEDELQGLILHEVRHVTDMHIMRCGDRNPKKFNVAADHVINLDIIDAGFKLPSEVLYDPQYRGMSVEEVYDALPEDAECPMPDLQGGEPSQGEETGDIKQIEQDVKDMLIQAVQIAKRQADSKAAGNIPAHILRQVDAWLNPVVPWYTLLQRYMTSKCKDDYSWKRPNRRGRSQGLYIPSLYSEQVGSINIYMDLSGSVSDEMVNLQIGQFKYIHKHLHPKEIRIVTFTTRIEDEFVFAPNDSIDVEFHGRGGTSLREVIPHMQEHPAEVHLIFTDGYLQHMDLDGISGDVVFCIYDNPTFTYEGASKIIYIPEDV